MKRFHFSILGLLLACLLFRSQAQESISPEAKKFCDQLEAAATSKTKTRADSVVRTFRTRVITEKELMNIANNMTRGGDGAMAVAFYILFRISEASTDRYSQNAIFILNDLYRKNASRRDQILRSMH